MTDPRVILIMNHSDGPFSYYIFNREPILSGKNTEPIWTNVIAQASNVPKNDYAYFQIPTVYVLWGGDDDPNAHQPAVYVGRDEQTSSSSTSLAETTTRATGITWKVKFWITYAYFQADGSWDQDAAATPLMVDMTKQNVVHILHRPGPDTGTALTVRHQNELR